MHQQSITIKLVYEFITKSLHASELQRPEYSPSIFVLAFYGVITTNLNVFYWEFMQWTKTQRKIDISGVKVLNYFSCMPQV